MTSTEEKDTKEKIACCLGRRWLRRRYPKVCLKGLTSSPEEQVFLLSSRYLVYRWSLLGLLIDKAKDPTKISLTLPLPFHPSQLPEPLYGFTWKIPRSSF